MVALVAACGGKIAPDGDAGLAGTCGAHEEKRPNTGPSCGSRDSVTCTTGVYAVACNCTAGTCGCERDGVVMKTVSSADCSCNPTREQLFGVYAACGFPY